jgi:protein-L-isoaspartate(D-aspartate) O-methyltransferase
MTDFAVARQRMVTEQLLRRGIRDRRVLDAMGRVHRHRFLEEAFWARAYGDTALPIGEGQTISQPYMVALMTQALELKGDERVLEVGTGSGYQTAILAELAGKVYTIERITALAVRARQRLESLGYYNVLVRAGDGSMGWREKAPFDAIVISAAAPRVPPRLLEQLGERGRLVAPVGESDHQTLQKGIKSGSDVRWIEIGKCLFVKLVGGHASTWTARRRRVSTVGA